MNHRKQIKYAVLLVGSDVPEGTHTLDSHTHAKNNVFDELIKNSQVRYWKEWIGTLTWEEIVRNQGHILTWVETDHPEVLDDDNERAKRRLERCWYALQLCGHRNAGFAQMRRLTGRAHREESSRVTLVDVRGIDTLPELVRAFYTTREEYWNAFPNLGHDDWWPRFSNVDTLLSVNGGIPKLPTLLEMALVSFSQGQQSSLLDFRVPNYIRAAEAIVGLPRGSGQKKEFAQRCVAIVTGLDSDPFLATSDVANTLENLYQLRSDCVHGKVPFHDLHAQGATGQLEAAKLEYVAERVARELMLWALRHTRRNTVFADRDTLECEWKASSPPLQSFGVRKTIDVSADKPIDIF